VSKGLPALLLGLMVGIPAALPAAVPRDAWVVGATKSAAEKVAGHDEDVVAANELLDRALAGKPGLSDAVKAKSDAFLKVHYHVGRIEIRRDAAKRAPWWAARATWSGPSYGRSCTNSPAAEDMFTPPSRPQCAQRALGSGPVLLAGATPHDADGT